MRLIMTAAGVAAFGLTATAGAATYNSLMFDLNGLEAQTAGGVPFSTSYTGDVIVTADATGDLATILGDGADLRSNGTFTGVLDSFMATVSMTNGTISGGSFSIVLVSGEIYSASIAAGSGIVREIRTGFFFDGLTFDGGFTSSNYDGIDVSNFFDNIPLEGNFIEFAYNPDANGFDNTSNMNIFVSVPAPIGAGLGLAGLAGIASRRRRALA
jgi:MYXO-CTERM domain-containing protein